MAKIKRASLKGRGAGVFLDVNNSGQQDNQNAIQPDNQIKVTYIINDDIVERLEEFWFKLRRKFKGKKISKSRIVEVALNKIVEDWENEKNQSKIESNLMAGFK